MLVAVTVLALRRPTTLTRAEFFNEDGQVFYLGTYFGDLAEVLFRPYQGYLHLVPRVVSLGERVVPIELAPLLGNLLSLIVVAAVAGFVASERLAVAIPRRPVRLLLAVLILVLPGAFESLGSLTYVQWYLGIWLFLAAAATSPTGRLTTALDRAALAVASLTGPFSIMAAPLYVLRAVRQPSSANAWRASLVIVAACVQTALVVTSTGRAPSIRWPDVGSALAAAAYRGVVTPLIGFHRSTEVVAATPEGPIVVIASILVVALAAAAFAFAPAGIRLSLALGFAVSLAAGILGSTDSPAAMFSPGSSQRYFVIPGAMLSIAVVLAATSGRRLAVAAATPLVVLLLIGVASDFRLPVRPAHDWATRSTCIGGATPCLVPVEPPKALSIRWPGPDGPYIQGHAMELP